MVVGWIYRTQLEICSDQPALGFHAERMEPVACQPRYLGCPETPAQVVILPVSSGLQQNN